VPAPRSPVPGRAARCIHVPSAIRRGAPRGHPLLG
jgi:hypothetical protein